MKQSWDIALRWQWDPRSAVITTAGGIKDLRLLQTLTLHSPQIALNISLILPSTPVSCCLNADHILPSTMASYWWFSLPSTFAKYCLQHWSHIAFNTSQSHKLPSTLVSYFVQRWLHIAFNIGLILPSTQVTHCLQHWPHIAFSTGQILPWQKYSLPNWWTYSKQDH